MSSNVLRAASLLALVLSASACKPGMLPDSTVENTAQNREIAALLERYRAGLEKKDINAILSLVSDQYFEDSGTVDPSDDYNFDGLKQHLSDDLSRVQVMRVTVRLHRVNVDGDRAYVDYRFQTRALLSFPSADQWMTKTDDNRLALRREGGRWRIVAGL